ncbi:hypothetical protein [Saccharopolyspora hattusasensis]|uniref:hypothetical protein n=1 Tax=Saccharopolyspora hattusasensis TaxID=1128679 RepID=UPI003D96D813
MPPPPVPAEERARIEQLLLDGVRPYHIVKQVGRSEWAVWRIREMLCDQVHDDDIDTWRMRGPGWLGNNLGHRLAEPRFPHVTEAVHGWLSDRVQLHQVINAIEKAALMRKKRS